MNSADSLDFPLQVTKEDLEGINFVHVTEPPPAMESNRLYWLILHLQGFTMSDSPEAYPLQQGYKALSLAAQAFDVAQWNFSGTFSEFCAYKMLAGVNRITFPALWEEFCIILFLTVLKEEGHLVIVLDFHQEVQIPQMLQHPKIVYVTLMP